MKVRVLPVFIPFAGCTNRCIYCSQSKITGVSEGDIISSAKAQIDEHLSFDESWSELAFYGGSFTCLDKNLQTELYNLAKSAGFEHIRISTSPDCVSEDVLNLAEENGVRTVELGIQSFDNDVLRLNKRPYNRETALSAIDKVKGRFEMSCQIMVCMHGEKRGSFINTVETAASLGCNYARIYPTAVISGTELADMYGRGEYKPCSLSEAVLRSAFAFIMFESAGTKVIRIGLHDGAGLKENVIAGAYHASLGELVKTAVLAHYFANGGNVKVSKQRKSSVCGAYGYLAKKYPESILEAENDAVIDWHSISKKISGGIIENYGRFFEGAAAVCAEELESKTHNG